MQAIILAAGMGKRLKEYTRENTKCMVKVDGVTLIERMLRQIDRYHLSKIIIVVGYQGEKLKQFITSLEIKTPIIFLNNSIYDKTNNIYSLALTKKYLREDDTLLFESDLIFEDSVLEVLLKDPRETLALVDYYQSWMDGTCMKLGVNGQIEKFISHDNFEFSESESYFKTVNIYKFSKSFSESYYIPFLNAYMEVFGNNVYYEQVLKVITLLGNPSIYAKCLDGQKWYEIDDVQDLDIAESMFASTGEKRTLLLKERFGGYWRYPGMIDFCYLVNPYFPTQRMLDEIGNNFSVLMRSYPSGMRINTLLASKNFDISQENIIVANGAAELIKALLDKMSGKTGFICPTFEEYLNRYPREMAIIFSPSNKDFKYSALDIISFFSGRKVENIVIINPDNPSGNYMSKDELFTLIKWTKENMIHLVIDESFADFADEKENTLFDREILDKNQHLCVIKSISKSYGVPGLRLGIMASGDKSLVQSIRRDVPIWNINSVAEFFMQIIGKYSNDYILSLEKIRVERKYLYENLSKIYGIRPIESQANYLMVELTEKITAKRLTENLLTKYNILIKDLSEKISDGQYVRLAVRNHEDNDCLLSALVKELHLNNNF